MTKNVSLALRRGRRHDIGVLSIVTVFSNGKVIPVATIALSALSSFQAGENAQRFSFPQISQRTKQTNGKSTDDNRVAADRVRVTLQNHWRIRYLSFDYSANETDDNRTTIECDSIEWRHC